jgi:hypothetical protein
MNELKYKLSYSYVALEWTTALPTEEGWYWAIHEDEGCVVANVVKGEGSVDFMARLPGIDMLFVLIGFTHWLGPLPVPVPPNEIKV